MSEYCESNGGSGSTGKAVINGVKLHYEVRGDGSHPILCIPGALLTARTSFGPQLDYFGRPGSGFTIVSFDPRGYGASRPANRYGENFYLQDALDGVGLMQHLSFPSYSVLGWCGGGISALFMAARYPDKVKMIATIGSRAFATQEDLQRYETFRDESALSPEYRRIFLKLYGESAQSIWCEWIDSFKQLVIKNDGDICKKELCKIQCPTLICHGAIDPVVPLSHSEYLHKHITGSQLMVMEKGKHDIHLKFSEEFNKKLEEYLKSNNS